MDIYSINYRIIDAFAMKAIFRSKEKQVTKVSPHEDKKLNILRWLTMGVAGYYLYQAYKKEGNLLGATGKVKSIDINTDKIVDSVSPWVNIPDHQKDMVMDGLKEFARNVKEELKKR